MGLFSKKPTPEPLIVPTHDLLGRPQHHPESEDTLPRRQRLYRHAQGLLAGHPLTGARAYGLPLSDAQGMAELVRVVEPLFAKERSLLRWVALRGALTSLAQMGPMAWSEAATCVGLELVEDRDGFTDVRLQRQFTSGSAGEEHQAAGLFNALMMRVTRYDEIAAMPMDEVNSCATFLTPGIINDRIALDFIAWVAAVELRMEAKGMIPSVREGAAVPSRLDSPGWYVDPVFARAHRFWDGADWTAHMRVVQGGRVHFIDQRLREFA